MVNLDLINKIINCFVCRKCHLSLMICSWSVKGRTNSSVVRMYSGNGETEEGKL